MMIAGAIHGQDYRESLLSVVLAGEKVDSPRIGLTPDGRLLVCARQLAPAPATTRVYVSADLGRTWETIHDFAANLYGPSYFSLGGNMFLFFRDSPATKVAERRGLVLAQSADGGRSWRQTALLPLNAATAGLPPGSTTGNTPVLVTAEQVIVAVCDWGGSGSQFPEPARVACGWCPVGSDPMVAANWTWTPPLEMPAPCSAPDNKGGWLEPNPVIGPDGQLVLLVRVDSADGELGAIIRVNQAQGVLEFTDRFPAEPGQTGFIRMPGGGNGMFFVQHDPGSGRYLAVGNPRTGGATPLWGHTRVRNCLALFESDDLYHWRWVRALVRDDQGLNWRESARHTGFQQPSWVTVGDDLYVVSRTAYGQTGNWHDANRITVHLLRDFRRFLDADGEVAHYRFDRPDDLGADSSRQGGNHADVAGAVWDSAGHAGGCARFDGKGFLDLRYRVSSEFHYAERLTIAAWVNADNLSGRIVDFPIDDVRNGIAVGLVEGRLVVGGRSCAADAWQKVTFPFPGTGRWCHVAVEMDYPARRIRAWIDGQEVPGDGTVVYGSDCYKRQLPTIPDVVGVSHSHSGPFVGRLDDLRFFRRALTAAELREMATR